jgi:hypothetical protein
MARIHAKILASTLAAMFLGAAIDNAQYPNKTIQIINP